MGNTPDPPLHVGSLHVQGGIAGKVRHDQAPLARENGKSLSGAAAAQKISFEPVRLCNTWACASDRYWSQDCTNEPHWAQWKLGHINAEVCDQPGLLLAVHSDLQGECHSYQDLQS